MQQLAIVIVEPSQIVANIIRKSLEASEFRCVVMRDPATFAATLDYADTPPTAQHRAMYEALHRRLTEQLAAWQRLRNGQLASAL